PITAKLPIGDKSDKHIPFAIPYQMIIGTRERFFLLLLHPLLEDRETDSIQFPPRVVKLMLRTIYIYIIHSHIIFPMNIPLSRNHITVAKPAHTIARILIMPFRKPFSRLRHNQVSPK